MSSEIQDEVEALNSIYGPSTLSPTDSPTSLILNLPGDAQTALRLTVPESYPDAPPEVHSTFSSGEASRGDAAAELALFREAVGVVFQPGMPCLYDAIEEFSSLLSSRAEVLRAASPEPAEAAPESTGHTHAYAHAHADHAPEEQDPSLLPPWTLSAPMTEQRSTFIARIAPVSSTSQAQSYLAHLLSTDRKVRQATHNITAWRIRGEGGTSFQDCDDDGETAAGGRLLHLMQVMDVWDAMVVVTRWYGGLKLGPRRFALINGAARDGFVRAGLVKEGGEDKKKKGR